MIAYHLWHSRTAAARVARSLLLAPSFAYRLAGELRLRAYRLGFLPVGRPGCPVVAVGNLSVGGTGKTPIAAWIASYYAAKGVTPGVVLRGYGGDEAQVHRELTPEARVVENPDRMAGVNEARKLGAQVVILDDAFQRLDVARDLNLLLVSAESGNSVPWLLPAGPWREPWREAARADFIVVTRKVADRETAGAVAARAAALLGEDRVAEAHLHIGRLETLEGSRLVAPGEIAGGRLLAVCAVADPVSFRQQLATFSCRVNLMAWRDHHAYQARDLERIRAKARHFDYVVVTAKDAGKLARHWRGGEPEILVARQEVCWERGLGELQRRLDAVLALGVERLSGCTTL